MQIETKRLILREYTPDDFDALHAIFSDAETMRHYPKPFDAEMTRAWIEHNIERYATFGFGLWAAVLKESGECIGDCGVSMQMINGVIRPEIGWHIRRDHQRQGYASEAGRACRDYIFENTPFNRVYSYMKTTNAASAATAVRIGMKFIEEYPDPVNEYSRAYAVTREEWQRLKEEEA